MECVSACFATSYKTDRHIFKIEYNENGIFDDGRQYWFADAECFLKLECPSKFSLYANLRVSEHPGLLGIRLMVCDETKTHIWQRRINDLSNSPDFIEIKVLFEDIQTRLQTTWCSIYYVIVELDKTGEMLELTSNDGRIVCVSK